MTHSTRQDSSAPSAQPVETTTSPSIGQALDIARAQYAAGQLDAAVRQLTSLGKSPLPPLVSMQAASLRARVAARTSPAETTAAAREAVIALDQIEVQLSADQLADAFIACYLAGDIERAESLMTQAGERGAANPEAALYEGLIHAARERHEEAIAALQRAGAIDGDDLKLRRLQALASSLEASGQTQEAAEVYCELGKSHYDASRYPEALEAMERTVALDPSHVEALAHKGELLRLIGNRGDEAVATLEEALRLKPDYAWALVVYGETLHTMNRLSEAADAFRRAIELNASVPQWHYRWGEVLRLLGRHEEALARFDRAIELGATDATTISRRGEVLRLLSRYDEALAVFDQALSLAPGDSWSLSSKGEALRQMGRAPEAEVVLQETLRGDPENPFVLASLGHTLLGLNRDAEALHAFEEAVHRAGERTDLRAWAMEGQVHALLRLDRADEGLKVADQLIALQPEFGWAVCVKGALLFLGEQYEQASEHFERGLKLSPEMMWAINHLAVNDLWWSRAEGADATALIEKAIAASRKAVESAEQDPSYRGTLADALWLHGPSREKAVDEYNKILKGAKTAEKLDFYAAYEGGWAAFRLASATDGERGVLLDEAERLNVEALTRKHDRPGSTEALGVKFNLAQILLCSGRFGLALREYDRALPLAQSLEPAVRRGLIGRTRITLRETLPYWPKLQESPVVQKVLLKLDHAYDGLLSGATAEAVAEP